MGAGTVSDVLPALGRLFPSTVLPHPALVGEAMSSLPENSYAMAGRYMQGLPFSRKKEERERKKRGIDGQGRAKVVGRAERKGK